MSIQVAVALRRESDAVDAAAAAAASIAGSLSGGEPDLAVVFASGSHLADAGALVAALHAQLMPRALIGCGAGGVLGSRSELEDVTGLAVWAASFDEGAGATPFHATAPALPLDPEIEGLPPLDATTATILLADPHTFPADPALTALAESAPGVPVLGGLASGRGPDGALFIGDEVIDDGAVGVCLQGVEVLPCVSQGAAPVGRDLTITAAEGNIIHELAGRPALHTVEQIIAELPRRERVLVAGGLLLGIVIDSGKPEFEPGDFLVRGILGADPEAGSLVIGAPVSEGQVVQLHARDARSADEDLRRSLRLQVEALAGARPAGSLVFSCNGRGRAMFGATNHDAEAVHHELRGAPAAGFFAAGEIGPVAGRSFLHGFTATLAVFPQ